MESNEQNLLHLPLDLTDVEFPNTAQEGLRQVVARLTRTLERDRLVRDTLRKARQQLGVDRLVLYYFFQAWRGQVTSEALAHPSLSILGSRGVDDCFNQDHAALYLQGRICAIANVATADIADCHREFLMSLQVKANLVAPVLVKGHLWGLLVAHHCQAPRDWSAADRDSLQAAAHTLSEAAVIQAS